MHEPLINAPAIPECSLGLLAEAHNIILQCKPVSINQMSKPMHSNIDNGKISDTDKMAHH
jgi:hypothetical protein